jgi:ABC-type transporter Mla MlaB component
MKDYKVQTNTTGDKEKMEIILSGDLTLKNSSGFYEQLKSVKQTYKKYCLVLKDVTKIDVSCLQIIL